MHTKIADMEIGKKYSGVYILLEHSVKIARNNSPYIHVKLSDKSGEIQGNFFINGDPDAYQFLTDGDVVSVTVLVESYGGKSISVKAMAPVMDKSAIDMSDLVQTTPEPVQTYLDEMMQTATGMQNLYLRNVVSTILQENYQALMTAPAAKTYHHACQGGLAWHTCGMLRLAKRIASCYPAEILNKELLLAGVLLHDIQKIAEMHTSNLGVVDKYTEPGYLLGHIFMGAEYVGQVCDRFQTPVRLKIALQHMILSHHGKKEYGSPVEPMCLEAYLLHEIDNIDAKVNTYTRYINTLHAGEFEYDRSMEHMVWNHGLIEESPSVPNMPTQQNYPAYNNAPPMNSPMPAFMGNTNSFMMPSSSVQTDHYTDNYEEGMLPLIGDPQL